MITYHYELKPTPNGQGRFPIYLRLTENRKHTLIKTSVALAKVKDWNKDAEQVRKSEPFAEVWNNALAQYLERAKAIERKLTDEDGTPTIGQVANKLKDKEHKATLLAFAKECMQAKDNLGTQDRWGQSINKLQAYLTKGGRVVDIAFKEVTPAFVDGYEDFLQRWQNSRDRSRGLSANTIAKEFKTLRAILNKAVEAGLMQERNMPANLKAKVKETPTAIVGLEDWELQKIAQADLQTGSHLWNARNLYLFAMYAQGMRLGDALQLRWQNIEGDRLRYQMDKVDKPTDIKVLPVMREILDLYRTEATAPTDYIFPYLNNTAIYAPFATYEKRQTMPAEVAKKLYNAIKAREHKIDIAVKELAEVAGVRRFTFHTGRHSFAMKAIDKGVDAYTTMKMLNHSSLAVTERYLNRLDTEKEDTALQKIFGEQGKLEQATKLVEALKGLGLDKETIAGLLDR